MLLKLAWGNVRKSARDFSIYFITVALGVAVFYAFNSVCDQEAFSLIGDTSAIRRLLGEIVSYVSVFIVVVLGFLVIYANNFLVRRRAKEFGLYLVLGMRTSQVLSIVGLETLIVGALSLVCGFAVGILISEGLLFATAYFFGETIEGFVFGFSVDSALRTLAIFGAIFVLAALINGRRIAGTPLIGLLHADRKNETVIIRNPLVSFILFIIACAMIGYSYKLLIDNGLLEPSPEFLAATVLVCIGTALFFYSISGFLLKVIQWIKPLYLHGLNMFTLRQLNAKLNSTVASMTIVCITLFLSITSVTGGIGIMNAMDKTAREGTLYDASVSTFWYSGIDFEQAELPQANPELGSYAQFAAEHNWNMLEGLELSAQTVDSARLAPLVQASAQIDNWYDPAKPVLLKDFNEKASRSIEDLLGNYMSEGALDSVYIPLMKLSQVNAALELSGREPISLAFNEAKLIYTSAFMADFWREFDQKNITIEIGNKEVTVGSVESLYLQTTPMPMDTGTLIVNDDIIPTTAVRTSSILDVMLSGETAQGDFASIVDSIQDSTIPDTWPVNTSMTKEEVLNQTSGMTGLIAFLAVYIGFILTVACAAILAIQQLSEASDNARRYALLKKLGAPSIAIGASLFVQILIYFLAPLLLALCHSACALSVVSTVIALFGNLDIGQAALLAAGAFLATYGVYFLLTFITARRLSSTA